MDITRLDEETRVELAFEARKARLAHPRGDTDGGGRWYPDVSAEGGTPAVRSPSRAWPWSYMLACRTRRWCSELPETTRDEDAAVAAIAIAAGRMTPSPRLVKLLGQ